MDSRRARFPSGYKPELVDPTVTDRKKSKKRIVVVEEEAKIVRRIYVLYLDYYGYTAIARILNTEGATSPRGKGWCHTGIWEILRNPCYAGEWTYGRRRTVARVGGRRIIEKAAAKELVSTKRPDLAIVSPDVFVRVQVALAERSKDMK